MAEPRTIAEITRETWRVLHAAGMFSPRVAARIGLQVKPLPSRPPSPTPNTEI